MNLLKDTVLLELFLLYFMKHGMVGSYFLGQSVMIVLVFQLLKFLMPFRSFMPNALKVSVVTIHTIIVVELKKAEVASNDVLST